MSPSLPDQVWAVVPAYNEAARIGPTLSQLRRYCPRIVVVDDGSTDATGTLARAAGAWVLRHPLNCGQGAALQTGIAFALSRDARFIVTFDADGQHDAAEIPQLLAPLLADTADVALGSRFLDRPAEGLPFTRRWLLRAAVWFTRCFSGIRVTDTHNGFRAFTAAAARRFDLRHNRMAHASELLDQIRQHGLRFVEVPVTIRYTAATLAKGAIFLERIGHCRATAGREVAQVTPFQWLALPILSGLGSVELIRAARQSASRGTHLFRALVWLGAAAAIAVPDSLSWLANLLGIQRGADLLLYVLALTFVGVSFALYARIVLLRRQVTALVRHLALEHPLPPLNSTAEQQPCAKAG